MKWWVVCWLCFCLGGALGAPVTIYVSNESERSLQEVVDGARPGDEIVVEPGVYDHGGRATSAHGPMTRLVVDKPLKIRSAAGLEQTILIGGPETRCLYLTNGAELVGFTIAGGETARAGLEENKFLDLSGGGVWSEPGGMLTDCLVVSNTALWYGGGLYGGTARRCTFKDNRARRSGGATSHARLGNCLLASNRAGRYGGGAQRCELIHCTVAQNWAQVMGGGTAFGSALNSIIHGNQTQRGHHNYYGTEMMYSSSWPKPAGDGNVGGEPGFVNFDAGVFRLHRSSPAIDRGIATHLLQDLAGRPRALDGNENGRVRVDLGAYEFLNSE